MCRGGGGGGWSLPCRDFRSSSEGAAGGGRYSVTLVPNTRGMRRGAGVPEEGGVGGQTLSVVFSSWGLGGGGGYLNSL